MINNIKVLSPVTKTEDVVLLEMINSDVIVNSYMDLINVDVSRFFQNVKTVKLYKCNQTGYRFFEPIDILGDGKFYAELQTTINYYNPEKWEYKEALRHINASTNLLEIGCGSGFFLSKAIAKGADVKGIDFNEEAVLQAQKKGLNVENATIEQIAKLHPEEFDIICFFQVLEHIADVQDFLNSALKCLKREGKIIIGVPNNNPFLYKYDKFHALNLPPHHIGLWNKSSLKNLSSVLGTKLFKIKAEPLFNIKYQLQVILKHFNITWAHKIVAKIPSRIINKAGVIVRPFFKGRNLLAIYEKK